MVVLAFNPGSGGGVQQMFYQAVLVSLVSFSEFQDSQGYVHKETLS